MRVMNGGFMAETPKKTPKAPSTQRFLPIKEIREGTVVMKDGSMRAVIMVSSINFSLKNEEEKDSIINSYQGFLNSLEFPIQIMIASRKLHLDNYMKSLDDAYNSQTNELLRLQTSEYIAFIHELLEYANIMEKRFFVVIPFFPIGIKKDTFISKLINTPKQFDADFETLKMELSQRVDHVISGLSSVGLRCVALDTEDLIELYYTSYNPDTAGEEKIHNAEELEAPVIRKGDENAR
jgi:type IV secretory pathway VirB4 component